MSTETKDGAHPSGMRALVFRGEGRLEWEERPVPEPSAGEVRIRIARAAVCGTDVHKLGRAPGRQPRHADGRAVVSGHEPVGWIDLCGSDVAESRLGERVLVAGVVGCGVCAACGLGWNTACEAGPGGLHGSHDGSNAPYLVIPARNALPIPADMTFDVAAVLTCAGGTAITMVEETALRGDDTLAIVGLGPVGLSLLLLAQSYGCRVIGVDVNADRLARARALGLSDGDLVNARTEDAVAAVRRQTRGLGAEVVAECAGTARARESSLLMAKRRGRVALAGIGEEPDRLDVLAQAIKGDLVIRGIAATPIRYFPALIAQVARLQLRFAELITHHVPLGEAPRALALMAEGGCGKIILDVAQDGAA